METPEERRAKAIRDIMNENDGDGVMDGSRPSLENTNMLGCNTSKENRTHDISANANGKVKEEAGFTWTQTEEDLDVFIHVPASDSSLTSKDLSIQLDSRHVTVSYRGRPVINMSLFEAISAGTSTWTVEGSNVLLSLEKVEQALWARIEE